MTRFRCHGSSVCLHESHVCDGWPHCPLHDDETLCTSRHTQQSGCPGGCRCSSGQHLEMVCDMMAFSGLAITKQDGNMDILRNTKYLRLVSDGKNPSNPIQNGGKLDVIAPRLVKLEVTYSGIKQISSMLAPNLYELDMRGNQLLNLLPGTFRNSTEIRILDLSYNKLQNIDFHFLKYLRHLELLDMSYNNLTSVRQFSFLPCPKLKRIVLQGMGIRDISDEAFSGLASLQKLDLVDNTISRFGPSVLTGLSLLSSLHTDNYRLCCPQVVPQSLKRGTCEAPVNEISSCEDILSTEFFRGFLWAVAALTIIGNSGVLIYRLLVEGRMSRISGSGGRQHQKLGYSTFITSLAASDLLMCLIGGADVHYRGRYLWAFSQWTRSGLCSLAGFLCFVSSEVSEITIALVTLDRFLALAFPLSDKLHFSPFSARIASLTAWLIGVFLAAIPLLPQLDTLWDRFYSQNGVCIPLPITRARFPGKDYSFAVFVVFNMIIFLLIAIGQILVFWAVRSNSMNAQKTGIKKDKDSGRNIAGTDGEAKIDAHRNRQQQQEAAIARKLALVVASDFICWVPIGVLGLMSRMDVPVPGQASVAVSVFLLPLNAALNPFLYTLSAIFVNRGSRKKEMVKSQAVKKSKDRVGAAKRGAAPNSITGSRPTTSGDSRSSCEQAREIERPASPSREKRERLRQLEVWLALGKISRKEIHRCLQQYLKKTQASNTITC